MSNQAEATVDLILAEEGRLRRVARRFARCEADVDDLVQDTLLRAFRARARFTPGTSIRAWTSTILRRVFLTGALRTKRRATENDTDAGDVLLEVPGAAPPARCEFAPTYEKVAEGLDDSLKSAIERVPDVYREPLLLAAVEGLTCGDIARRLDVPEGTVMSRIHRARQRIKRDLADLRASKAAVSMRRRASAA